MKREPVRSSNIESIGYDPTSETLEIKFVKNNTPYQYHPVAAEMYVELMAAESHGKYFAAHIRGNKAIGYKRVQDTEA